MTTDSPDTAAAAILSALGRLDPANDEHWTKDGLPAIKALETLTGMVGLTRAAVEAVAPGFTREVSQAAAAGDGRSESTDPAGPDQTPAPTTTDSPDTAEGGDGEEDGGDDDEAEEPPVERQATLAECNAWASRIHADVGPRDTSTRRRVRKVVVQSTKA